MKKERVTETPGLIIRIYKCIQSKETMFKTVCAFLSCEALGHTLLVLLKDFCITYVSLGMCI